LKPEKFVNHPSQATIPKEKFGTVGINIYPHDFGIDNVHDNVHDAGGVLRASSSLEVLDAEKTTKGAELCPLTSSIKIKS
jgi:hypothetical protein